MIENGHLQRWFLIIFALFCVGMNVVAFVLYQKNESIIASKQWVSHTYDVITQEYKLFSAIQDRQSSVRGYLFTNSDDFLKLYETSDKSIQESLKVILRQVKDNPAQQGNLAKYISDLDEMTQFSLEQIAAKKAGKILDPLDITASKSRMDKMRAHHAIVLENEMQLLDARKRKESSLQKNYITTLFVTAAISAIGLLIANVIVAFLTYRRKFAEDSLRRTNKEMEGFTYIASHDLRSPLVNLKGFATEMGYSVDELRPLAERGAESLPEKDQKKIIEILDKDIPDALHYIHSSVEKMDKLTNAILELSRLGRRTIEFKPVETQKIVQHILDTLHHTISSQKIKVTLLPLPGVVADQLSLEQVFGNIIDNSIKYLDPSRPGEIEIGGVRAYRETKFWVRDNGRGIHSGDMEKIFEIYRRAGNTETIPGEGMGMAYVRTTLRRLGGQIWAESKPGQGTTFYFTINNALKKEQK